MELSISNQTGAAIEEELKQIFLGFMKKSTACKNRIEKLSSPIMVKIVIGKIGEEAYCEGTTVVLTTDGKTDKSSIDVAGMAEDLFFEIGNVMNDVSNKSIRKKFFKGELSLRGVGIEKSRYEAEQMWPYFLGLKDLKDNDVSLSESRLKHLKKHRGESEGEYKASFMSSKQSNKPNAPAVKKLISPDCYSYTILDETSILKIRTILKTKMIGAGAGNFREMLNNDLGISELSETDKQPVYWCITKMIDLLPNIVIPTGYKFSIEMENLVKKAVLKDQKTKTFFNNALQQCWGLSTIIPSGWWI